MVWEKQICAQDTLAYLSLHSRIIKERFLQGEGDGGGGGGGRSTHVQIHMSLTNKKYAN